MKNIVFNYYIKPKYYKYEFLHILLQSNFNTNVTIMA